MSVSKDSTEITEENLPLFPSVSVEIPELNRLLRLGYEIQEADAIGSSVVTLYLKKKP
jgi:hypothetical protein